MACMITISPAHALLILIDAYKKDAKKNLELKKLFLVGCNTPVEETQLAKFLQDPLLSAYQISNTSKVIDWDPCHRYFETHLAYEILQTSIQHINKKDLQTHRDILYDTIRKNISDKEMAKLDEILSGKSTTEDPVEFEFNDAIQRINHSKHYQSYTQENKDKLKLLINLGILGVYVINLYLEEIPMYINNHTDYFVSRGRVCKNQESNMPSNKQGILKSFMPIATDDIACADPWFHVLRPAERSTYDPHSLWVKANFKTQVHPYVNSISGTLLAQLRTFLAIEEVGQLQFNTLEKLSDFLRCFTSVLLYNSGGHTFHEFLSLLALPEVQSEFAAINLSVARLTELQLLFTEVTPAFDRALAKTLVYQQAYLRRCVLLASIGQEKKLLPIESKTNKPYSLEMNWANLLLESTQKHTQEHPAILVHDCAEKLASEKNSDQAKSLLLINAILTQLHVKEKSPTLFKKESLRSSLCNILKPYRAQFQEQIDHTFKKLNMSSTALEFKELGNLIFKKRSSLAFKFKKQNYLQKIIMQLNLLTHRTNADKKCRHEC